MLWLTPDFSSVITAILSAIALALLLTFPGWHREFTEDTGSERDVKPFPSRTITGAIFGLLTAASMLGIALLLWQHVGAVSVATTLQALAYGTVRSGVGSTAMALAWTGLACLILCDMAVYILISSISVLDRLTDD